MVQDIAILTTEDNSKLYMIYWMAPYSVTLNDPYLWSQGHTIILCWISEKVPRYKHSFNGILIGTYTRPTQQCHLPPTKEEVNAFARVCLSVCLLARLLKNAWMDLDEMFHVDRCQDMDELINFW